jgi:hypothetical protein
MGESPWHEFGALLGRRGLHCCGTRQNGRHGMANNLKLLAI